MKAEFTALVQKLIAEQGKEALFNTAKCKAFLADYTGSEYQNERRLLLQTVEAGITKAIAYTNDLAACKQQSVQKLQDEYYLAPKVTTGVVNLLVQVLQGEVVQKSDLSSKLVENIVVENKKTQQTALYPEKYRVRNRWILGGWTSAVAGKETQQQIIKNNIASDVPQCEEPVQNASWSQPDTEKILIDAAVVVCELLFPPYGLIHGKMKISNQRVLFLPSTFRNAGFKYDTLEIRFENISQVRKAEKYLLLYPSIDITTTSSATFRFSGYGKISKAFVILKDLLPRGVVI
jgi:hypothetical protein